MAAVYSLAAIVVAGMLVLPQVQRTIIASFISNASSPSSNSGGDPPQPNPIWNAAQLPVFESTVTRAVPADEGNRVKLIASNANVQILPSNSQQLEVRVVRTVAAGDQLEASTLFSEHQLKFTPDSSGWIVKSLIDADKIPDLFGPFSIRVYVPDGYGVDLPPSEANVLAGVTDGKLETSGEETIFAYTIPDKIIRHKPKTNYEYTRNKEKE